MTARTHSTFTRFILDASEETTDALTCACCSKHPLWTTGSFNSVYALQISFLHANNSNLSVRPGMLRCLQTHRRNITNIHQHQYVVTYSTVWLHHVDQLMISDDITSVIYNSCDFRCNLIDNNWQTKTLITICAAGIWLRKSQTNDITKITFVIFVNGRTCVQHFSGSQICNWKSH